MRILFNLFPQGRTKALTMSYDDGQIFDLRLAEIFGENGIKATFHLNSGMLGTEGFISPAEARTFLAGHEISVHTKTHPFLERLPAQLVAQEIIDDKKALEDICGYPVRGMSYPYGTYSAPLKEYLRSLGMEYSRTVAATGRFHLPCDFLEWHPTLHHNDDLDGLWNVFMNPRPYEKSMRCMYIWGHSFEFDRENNWDRIESFCKKAGGAPDVWYATNIEIMDYAAAINNLKFSADQSMIQNLSITDVWLSIDGEAVCIKSGETYRHGRL